MATLYRKYRPQTWEEVVGQNQIKLTLQREIETGKLAHAFLFSGPRGIGKTTIARLLAKSLNCEKRPESKSEPCGQCSSCQDIAGGRSIDVLEIDAASHTGVENVRENIIESSRFLPSKDKYKIFIIDEVHMLTTGAFNALLKVMEEPPPHVIFVLATTELFKLPLTVVSRCQRFDFKKANIDDIVKRLKKIAESEGVKVEKKVLEQVAYRSEGGLRDAESLLGQIISLGEKNITEKEASLVLPRSSFNEAAELLDMISKNQLKEGLIYLNKLADDGIDLFKFSEDVIELSRFLMILKLSGDLSKIAAALDEKSIKTINGLSPGFTVEKLIETINAFLKYKGLLRSSPIPQLPLELALVALSDGLPQVGASDEKEEKKSLRSEEPENSPLEENFNEKKGKAAKNGSVPLLSLDFVKEKWDNFLKKAQEYNHSLPLILRMSEPVGIRGETVAIKVKYAFHRDKLQEPKLRALAEKVLSEVLSQEAKLEATL